MFLNDETPNSDTQEITPTGFDADVQTAGELLIPIDALEQQAEPKTQAEIHQILYEGDMRNAAKARLYAKGTIDVDGVPVEYNEFDIDTERNLKPLSNKGEREVQSSFVSTYLSRVAKTIRLNTAALALSLNDSTETSQRKLHEAMERITNTIDYETISLIGLTNVLSGVQFGNRPAPAERVITLNIGKEMEFECFTNYVNSIDPALMEYISKRGTNDPNTRRGKRLSGFVQTVDDFYDVEWEWFSERDLNRLGRHVLNCVFEGTDSFVTEKVFGSNGHKQEAIFLSDKGIQQKESILIRAEDSIGVNYPMICPPRDWDDYGIGGGYLTPQPYPRNVLVRNSMGTQVSHAAIKAVNSLQRQAWQINPYIFNICKSLINRNIEIGSFRAFNEDMYDTVDNPNIVDPEDLRYSWDDETLTEEQIKRRNMAYRVQKLWEQEKSLTGQKAINPRRVLLMAEQILNLEIEGVKYNTFYLPWFMDNRTRCYPMVDTLNCQGSDYQKALMQFQKGVPVSEESRRDLLISIATTYGNKIDKKSYAAREEWARGQETLMKLIVADPLSETSMDFWTTADEPFQFLALCHEYVNCFLYQIQNYHYVSSGRDATCSGIQITGAMLRDPRTCKLVNVLPSDEPQDAYNDVAAEARRLLTDKEWLTAAHDRNEKNRLKRCDIWWKQFNELKAEGKRTDAQAPPEYQRRELIDIATDMKEWIKFIDRSVAKMPTMLIPYGGSYLTIYGHVRDKLQKSTDLIASSDFTIITHALIEGMARSLPAFSAVNAWFQSLAKAALEVPREDGEDSYIKWETPNGSLVCQVYTNPTTTSVTTYLGDATTTRRYNIQGEDWENINKSKMRTALAANVVHSVDAAIIQNTVNHIVDADPEIPFTAVHDCIYGPSGVIHELQKAVRLSFYECTMNNITESIAIDNLPNEQYRELVPKLQVGDAPVNLENLLKSDYLFS
jgi:hypothetical protein